MITLERLKELVHYDPLTGVLTWKIANSVRVKVGDRAGWLDAQNGYWKINIDGVRYQAHRIVWFYMTGEWPVPSPDHKDTNRSNNQWSNLRLADASQQIMNTGLRKDNKSGIKGVSWCNTKRRWAAEINERGTKHFIGYFRELSDASDAIGSYRDRLHGEFARAA